METLRDYLADRKKGDFARQLGTTPQYLSSILSGARRPGFDLMVKIERETGGAVPVSAWVDQAGKVA